MTAKSNKQIKIISIFTFLFVLLLMFFALTQSTTAQQACEPAWSPTTTYVGGR